MFNREIQTMPDDEEKNRKADAEWQGDDPQEQEAKTVIRPDEDDK